MDLKVNYGSTKESGGNIKMMLFNSCFCSFELTHSLHNPVCNIRSFIFAGIVDCCHTTYKKFNYKIDSS